MHLGIRQPIGGLALSVETLAVHHDDVPALRCGLGFLSSPGLLRLAETADPRPLLKVHPPRRIIAAQARLGVLTVRIANRYLRSPFLDAHDVPSLARSGRDWASTWRTMSAIGRCSTYAAARSRSYRSSSRSTVTRFMTSAYAYLSTCVLQYATASPCVTRIRGRAVRGEKNTPHGSVRSPKPLDIDGVSRSVTIVAAC